MRSYKLLKKSLIGGLEMENKKYLNMRVMNENLHDQRENRDVPTVRDHIIVYNFIQNKNITLTLLNPTNIEISVRTYPLIKPTISITCLIIRRVKSNALYHIHIF